MSPAPGERLLRFVGDCLQFHLGWTQSPSAIRSEPSGWQARLRSNLGRGRAMRQEIIHEHFGRLPLPGASWQDIVMRRTEDGWTLSLPLTLPLTLPLPLSLTLPSTSTLSLTFLFILDL